MGTSGGARRGRTLARPAEGRHLSLAGGERIGALAADAGGAGQAGGGGGGRRARPGSAPAPGPEDGEVLLARHARDAGAAGARARSAAGLEDRKSTRLNS